MSRRIFHGILTLLLIPILLSSCGGPKTFQTISMPEVGMTIEVASDWLMTVKSEDKSAYKSRLEFQPDYAMPPVTAAKGDPTQEYANPIPNWRFIGIKGEFDPEMNPLRDPYPVPEGLYFVQSLKGELEYEKVEDLPWPGAEGVKATVRLYEITHGLESLGTADLWNAYTVTFNHKGNAMEFNFQIPSGAGADNWIDAFWSSIVKMELS